MAVVRVCGLILGIGVVAVVAARVSAQGPGVMTVDEIRLVDKTGALRAHLLIGTNNATVLNLNGPDGYPRLSLAVDTAGTPSVLFTEPYDFTQEMNWDVTPGGRFLMIRADPRSTQQFQVVLNWFEEIGER